MTASSVISRNRFLAVILGALILATLAALALQVGGARSGAANVSAATGIRITMTVKGSKQGVFKGEDSSLGARVAGVIDVTAYSFEIVSPRDPSTGQATGRRIYKPLTITHLMGGSSPQFLAATATNETLNPVVINFYRSDRTVSTTIALR